MTPHKARSRVEHYAEELADTACSLVDTARPDVWSPEAKDDALEAIDTLAQALSTLGPEIAAALAPVRADARRHLGLPHSEAPRPVPRTVRRPQRRGFGPGFKDI